MLGPATRLIDRSTAAPRCSASTGSFGASRGGSESKPSETICIGDEIRDIEAAKAAGMDLGAVAWGYAIPSALQAAGPTNLFSSIEEITEWFAGAK